MLAGGKGEVFWAWGMRRCFLYSADRDKDGSISLAGQTTEPLKPNPKAQETNPDHTQG